MSASARRRAADPSPVATARVSNGPQVLYPAPSAMGGAPVSTHWVLDSFARDPWAKTSMLAAGERVATESGVTRGELDERGYLLHGRLFTAKASSLRAARASLPCLTRQPIRFARSF